MINCIFFKLSNRKLLFQQQETKTLYVNGSPLGVAVIIRADCVCNCDHSSLMERGPFVVMSMTYMPTSADTLFVLCIFRSLILVHSFINEVASRFSILGKRKRQRFIHHQQLQQQQQLLDSWTRSTVFYRLRRLLSSSTAEGVERASFGDQTFPKFQSIFSALFSAWTICSSNSVLSANLKNPLGSCCFQIGRWRRKTNRKLLLVSK